MNVATAVLRVSKSLPSATLLVLIVAVAACQTVSPQRDLDLQRLDRSLDQLSADPKLGNLAPAELNMARAAVQVTKDTKPGGDDGVSQTYVAERRVDTAWAAAQAAEMENRRADLKQENDRLLLLSARRDAAQARAEVERQRLQLQIQAEDAARLAQEAQDARAEGEKSAQEAEAARAVAAQQKRIADAQAKAAALSKKEAALSAAAAKARREKTADKGDDKHR
ncbi:MAG: hypothetical protein ABI451_05120 [Dokdonella sp.]